MRSRRDDERGTTLIELLVASAIALTMLGSIAMTTAVIGGQATTLYHGAHAASNAEQLLDHAATQLGNAEQLGVCTQVPCAASSFPASPLLAASSSGLCFAAPLTPALGANTTPNSPPEAVCIVTGGTSVSGTSVNRLYLDVYPPSASSYAACTSFSDCFTTPPTTCMGALTRGSCSGSGITSYYLGVLTSTTPFSYYDSSGNPVTVSTTSASTQLDTIRAVQMDVTISAGYSTGHVPLSYTLDYTATLH